LEFRVRRARLVFLFLAVALGCTGPTGPGDAPPMQRKASDARIPCRGLWISHQEIRRLPMSGPAWERLLQTANALADTPNVALQDQMNDVQVMAKALVYVRTGNESYRNQVVDNIRRAQGTEVGARTLAIGFSLPAYVIAADLVELSPADDANFRTWLHRCVEQPFVDDLLIHTFEDRPNNWGTHAGAAFIAGELYLSNWAAVAHAALVFRGWLGDRSAYAGFDFGNPSWQADSLHPVAINPVGARRAGYPIDGVLPDDQRRSGTFVWPPPKENYCYTALQGAVVEAELLSRAGFSNVWHWQNDALLRAYAWLHLVAAFPPQGDDTWITPLIDYYYGTNLWDGSTTRPGKNVGWTDWTHNPRYAPQTHRSHRPLHLRDGG
jgi:hypothetical protein